METTNNSKIISSISYVHKGQLEQHSFSSNSNIVSLSDNLKMNKLDCDTLLGLIECSLAHDFSEYYEKFDEKLGVSYMKVSKCRLSFNDGTSIVYNNNELSYNSESSIYCIRQVNMDNIRSFETLSDTDNPYKNIGADMFVMSDIMSDNLWVYLETLVNKVVGYNYVSVNVMTRKLSFTKEDAVANSIYLLLSEIFVLCSGIDVLVYVLISQMPNDEEISKRLVDALSKIRFNCQVFIP